MTQGPHHGLIGLGTMGAALALNIAENGYGLAVFNRTPEVTRTFLATAGQLADRLTAPESLEAFVAAITPPRTILLIVPAGPVVDAQIDALRRFCCANRLRAEVPLSPGGLSPRLP